MKKIVAVMLAMIIMLGMCTIIAHAEGETEPTVEYALDCLETLEAEINAIAIVLIIVGVIAAGSICWNIVLNYKLSITRHQLTEHLDKKNKKKRK